MLAAIARPRSPGSLWRLGRPAGLAAATAAASTGEEGKIVLGCGSNVVDHIYRVKVVPQAGAKGFFSNPFKALETRLVGGVTLNHLCWASLGAVPAGLMALQGNDELGRFIRSNLRSLGVSTDFIATNSSYSTAQCHVFIQDGGERSIVMGPAATSLINAEAVQQNFDAAIQQHASIVTTEISQVPLSGVLELLQSAKKAGVLSILDLDIPPSVAEREAGLGSVEEVVECVRSADVLKPAKAAADELAALMSGTQPNQNISQGDVAERLLKLCGSKLVAMTNGDQDCVIANSNHVVRVAPPSVSEVVDTTGAGDAFLGGLIVGIARHGGLPSGPEGLSELGRIANAFGATCVQSIGGVPTDTSRTILKQYLPDIDLLPVGSHDDGSAGFHTSLTNDLRAASAVCDALTAASLMPFISALNECQGTILTSGIGKSGMVASRFAGSLSSLGIPAHYVHAGEWVHGDLGKAVAGRDVVVFLSHSGGSEECRAAASHLVQRGVATLAITGNPESQLSRLALASLVYPPEGLAEPFQIMPTSTIVIQELLCNAVLCELIQRRGIAKQTFLSNHPGGNIGQKLNV